MKSTPAQRKAHVELLLESLEHRDSEIRFTNARRLFYILQGDPFFTMQNIRHMPETVRLYRYFRRNDIT